MALEGLGKQLARTRTALDAMIDQLNNGEVAQTAPATAAPEHAPRQQAADTPPALAPHLMRWAGTTGEIEQ